MSEPNGNVLIADRPKPIEAASGYGDWIPIVEMRRVFEHGKTVRLELAIRGREALAHLQLAAGQSVTLELPAVDCDIRPVVKHD